MLRRKQRRINFKEVVDQAYDHIIVTDKDGTILYANPAVSTTTGFSHNEVIGKTPRLWGGLMPKSFYAALWSTLKHDKKPFIGEIKNQHKNGTYYIADAHISPVLSQSKQIKYFIGIERDITAIKRLDDSRSEFISLVSHQLRTPLSTLNWYTESLLDGDTGKLTPKQRDYTHELYDATQRMIKLVNDLLNSTRIDFGNIRLQSTSIDLAEVVTNIFRDCEVSLKRKHLHVKNNVDKKATYTIQSDRPSVTVILENIITNAIKYTPPRGTIEVDITDSLQGYTISVKDTGYGIQKDDLEKIFEKYYRSESIKRVSTDGTGLGLYITKSFLLLLGGSIKVKSSNKGTTFYITIPKELATNEQK